MILKQYGNVGMNLYQEMYQELFPFSWVPKDSSIVIWGCGNVGSQYYDQIIKTGYCTIKYFVDKNWESMSGWTKFPVCNPEKLRKEKEVIVVIANGLTEQQEEIKAKLKEFGIEDERIVCEYLRWPLPIGNDMHLKIFRWYYQNLKIRKATRYPLVRVGNNYDGGYIMLDDFGGDRKIAYSFGISTDVSWDKDMTRRGYDVYMYDHTIDKLPYEDKQFHFKKQGIASSYFHGKELSTLEEILAENGHSNIKNMILKMDVERAEWGALCMTPISVLEQFDQIVMELHGMNRIDYMVGLRGFVLEKLATTHTVVHVHYNNCGTEQYIMGEIPIIDAYEVTFVNKKRYQFEDVEVDLPLDIDSPCNSHKKEICLKKWNNYFRD